MSLHAYWDGERIDRAQISRHNVDQVRSKAEESRTLVHPFCEHRVFIRSKSVGGRLRYHFAHFAKEKATCRWAGESESHLALKDTLVFESRRLGWDAEAEAGKSGKDRPDHIPDVLAVHPNTGQRVVFEVQVSSQGAEEYRRRQDLRTVVPNTRSLWLTRNADVAVEAGYVPIYHLERGDEKVATDLIATRYVLMADWVDAALRNRLDRPRTKHAWELWIAEEEARAAAEAAQHEALMAKLDAAEAARKAKKEADAEARRQRIAARNSASAADPARWGWGQLPPPAVAHNFRTYLDASYSQATRARAVAEDLRYGDGEVAQHGGHGGAAAHGLREAPTDLEADT